MQDWRDYDFVVDDGQEIVRSIDERTGWEAVRFEIADAEELNDTRLTPDV